MKKIILILVCISTVLCFNQRVLSAYEEPPVSPVAQNYSIWTKVTNENIVENVLNNPGFEDSAAPPVLWEVTQRALE